MEVIFMSADRVDLLTPRPAYSYYDRTGHLSVSGIWSLISDAYVEAEHKGFLTLAFEKCGFLSYRVRDKVIYSPDIHRKLSSIRRRILIRLSVASVGTTSYNFSQELLDPSSEQVLVRAESRNVAVSPITRRPCNIPKSFLNRYRRYSNVDNPSKLIKQESFTPPNDAFRSIVLTRYCDTDSNSHVNFTTYYKFCADCASEASLSSYYRHYDNDLSLYPVLETDVTFNGESPPCAKLVVFTWQDAGNAQKIYFAIYKKENKIFQASYLYSLEKSFDSKL